MAMATTPSAFVNLGAPPAAVAPRNVPPSHAFHGAGLQTESLSLCPASFVAPVGVALALRAVQRRRQSGLKIRSRGGEESADVPVSDTQLSELRRYETETIPGLEGQVVDEEAMLAQSSFALKPDDLIMMCKVILGRGVGTLKGSETDLADDFEFCAPVVGPIGKEEYLQALATFKILEAFPDSNPNYHGFRVDPFEPDRVWFQTRKTGTNTGEFMGKPATGKALMFPPEAYSLRFDGNLKVKEFTVGYPMDRRIGNTGGLGGAFGYFYGVGRPLPIPECQPYKRSWQFSVLNWFARTAKRIQGVKVKKVEN